MEPHETVHGATDGRSPSDAEIRAIAQRLLEEHDTPPPVNPQRELSAQRYGLSPADEERVSDALVELGAITPDATLRAEREAGLGGSPASLRGGERDGEPGGRDSR